MIIKRMKIALMASGIACLIPAMGCANSSENIENMSFTDVKKDAWYYDAVDYSYNNGLLEGVSKDKFMPDSNMTRAMFITVLGRKSKEDMSKYENRSSFDDVSKDVYYSKYVEWAKNNKIMIGDGKNNFSPERNITRQEAVKVLYEYYQFKYDFKYNDILKDEYKTIFDLKDISEYAKQPMAWSINSGIIKGVEFGYGIIDIKIQPNKNITRAEVAQIMKRLDDYEDFLSKDEIIDSSKIEAIEVHYDLGFPENEGKDFTITNHEEISKLIDKFNKEIKISELQNFYPEEFVGDPRLVITLNTKNDIKFDMFIFGENKEKNNSLVKGNKCFIFKKPISLDF